MKAAARSSKLEKQAWVWMTLCAGLMLGACSSPAKSYNMIVYQSDVVAAHPDTPFKHALVIARVDGGEETNHLWTSEVSGTEYRKALESSLGLSRLLADPASAARFDLYVNLAEVKRPFFGYGYTASSGIDYQVIEKETNRIWFRETVFGTFTAEMGRFCHIDPFDLSCNWRSLLRLANEGSIRGNINQFIKKLLESKPPLK